MLERVNALELDEFLPVFRIVTQSANSLVPCLITQPVDPHDLARKFLLFSKLEAFHISCIFTYLSAFIYLVSKVTPIAVVIFSFFRFTSWNLIV